ncbi:septation protein SepH [Agromyces archimandritae]|uniref:DUF3071 domain-containing protein n=1 Tax=Agromyces archimandritae TaxID=2781962 RepID=A0A975INF6_9MICO|nr:septation protein SepH [Agromyces archimandritae]QTX04567.1 DUF3071 domain-containing protein [Agromyces archimandritae]
MQELTVIGVEAGALVAASGDGARFRIEIDDAVLSRLKQAQKPVSDPGVKLSPREVQAHIRGGLSAEDVARITGASVDYVRRFEGPVIAEREHIVSSALGVPVHTVDALEPDEPSSFGSVIRERLAKLGADGERWASWKEEERGWVVKLEFTADDIAHDARWGFEPRKQTLQPINSEAVALSQHGDPKGRLVPRLRAVSDAVGDEQRFDSGAFTFDEPGEGVHDTAPQLEPLPYARTAHTVSSPAAARAAIKRAEEPKQQHGETADLLEALRRRRGEREAQQTGVVPERPRVPTPRDARPPMPPVRVPEPDDASEAEDTAAEPGAAARALWGGRGAGQQSTTSQPRAKKGRASMPSWDEIVFGARSDDDLA